MPAAYQAAVFVCVALTLGGCAADPIVNDRMGYKRGAWMIEAGHDRITNRPVSSAFTQTTKVATTDPDNPFGFEFPGAQLQLGCFKGDPIVRIAFPFKIGSTRTAELGYAFDRNVGHTPQARIVAGYSTVVIEDREEVARFAKGLANAKLAYTRVRSYGAGRTSAEFEVDGAVEALAAAYADCPLNKADPKAKQKTGARKPAPAASEADDNEEEQRWASRFERWKSEEERAFDQLSRGFRR
ncbi:MAG: hypothetical protein JO245_03700 [Pseudolabrys sp.]|nr:hypothetical protein [Pseudolabrys sp.]